MDFEKLFWVLISLQALFSAAFALIWPNYAVVWILFALCYLMMSYGITRFALIIGPINKKVYLITVAATSMNWLVFGAVGSMASSFIF